MMRGVEPLRILSVANVPEDPNAGAAGAEFQTIRALRALGHHVDAVWSNSITRRISHGNLHYLLELPRRYERVVEEHLSRQLYDIVHVNQPHGFRAARLVQKRWPRVAFFHRSHGFEPRVEEVVRGWKHVYDGDDRSLWRRGATSLLTTLLQQHNTAITRFADGHLLCSTQDALFMQERFSVPASRIAVIPHAAPDEYLQADVVPFSDARLRHVLYVGQFAFVKAPMIVAAAMNEIAAARDDVQFTWVASRAHHDAIRALLSPTVRGRIDLSDWMPQRELRDVYDRAGIFLFPSFFEGTGKASIEAMSRGLCVIASAVGGMRDMIRHEETGILVEPGRSAAVSAAGLALISNREHADRIAVAAAAHARRYTWNRTAVETAAFYSERLAAKRS